MQCDEGSEPPLARMGASATLLDYYEVLLFGGSCNGVPCNALDLIRTSGKNYELQSRLNVRQPRTQGEPPSPRFNHCAALVGGKQLAIFGGSGCSDGRAKLGNVSLLCTSTFVWSVIEYRGVPPAPRAGAVGVEAHGRMWIFGCASLGL